MLDHVLQTLLLVMEDSVVFGDIVRWRRVNSDCKHIVDADVLVQAVLCAKMRITGATGVPAMVRWLKRERDRVCVECCTPLPHVARCLIVRQVAPLDFRVLEFKLCDECRSSGYRRLVTLDEVRRMTSRPVSEDTLQRSLVRSVSLPYSDRRMYFAFEVETLCGL